MVHTYNGMYYSANKTINKILPFVTTWVNLEGIMLSEVSQTEKTNYYFTYLWNLKNKTNNTEANS